MNRWLVGCLSKENRASRGMEEGTGSDWRECESLWGQCYGSHSASLDSGRIGTITVLDKLTVLPDCLGVENVVLAEAVEEEKTVRCQHSVQASSFQIFRRTSVSIASVLVHHA